MRLSGETEIIYTLKHLFCLRILFHCSLRHCWCWFARSLSRLSDGPSSKIQLPKRFEWFTHHNMASIFALTSIKWYQFIWRRACDNTHFYWACECAWCVSKRNINTYSTESNDVIDLCEYLVITALYQMYKLLRTRQFKGQRVIEMNDIVVNDIEDDSKNKLIISELWTSWVLFRSVSYCTVSFHLSLKLKRCNKIN